MQIKAKLMELLDKRKAMMEMWQKRWDRLRLRECGDGVWVGRGIFGVIPLPPKLGVLNAAPFPQCWRCASSPGTPQWPSRG